MPLFMVFVSLILAPIELHGLVSNKKTNNWITPTHLMIAFEHDK